MFFKLKQILTASCLIAFSIAITSCESNFRDVQKTFVTEFMPSGEADTISMKYTDSGAIKAVLYGPKMKDYGTVTYPFTEFPNGVSLTLYDKNGKKTFIKSNYAIQYKRTEVIDLQGKVEIYNEDNQKLETEQLYFDQKNSWFYTEKKYKFSAPRGVSYGEGVDFDKDFKIMNTQKFSGQIEQTN